MNCFLKHFTLFLAYLPFKTISKCKEKIQSAPRVYEKTKTSSFPLVASLIKRVSQICNL